MGYPLDIAAQNACLDAMLGDNAATTMPTSFEVAMFDGDPSNGGAELTSDGGYARAVVANASSVFPDAVGGLKVSPLVSFALPSGAWSDTATHCLLIDAADSTTRYFVGRLTEDLAVDGTETSVGISPSIYWNVEA